MAADAESAAAQGDATRARERWLGVLALLPRGSRQASDVAARIAAQGPAPAPTTSPIFATRGTVFSMLASFGIYALAFGWELGLGLVLSIYIHELGHVAALRRYGIEPSALMFVPGLGAMVRWRGYPIKALQGAYIGLAGPLAGLGAALVACGVFVATESAAFGAIARAGALLNLINLLPVLPLDGGHGVRALGRWDRWLLAAVCLLVWRVSALQVLIILPLGAIASALLVPRGLTSDRAVFMLFTALVLALGALTYLIRVPVPNLLP